jgi:hypothetical protein
MHYNAVFRAHRVRGRQDTPTKKACVSELSPMARENLRNCENSGAGKRGLPEGVLLDVELFYFQV